MIERTISVKPTASELAKEFLFMDSSEQAKFFEVVSNDMSNWRPSEMGLQLCTIAESLGFKNAFIERLYEFIIDRR